MEYVVEDILDVRRIRTSKTKRIVQYHVKWQGYEESEWIDVRDMIPGCARLVRKFHRDNPDRNVSEMTQKLLRLHKGMEGAGNNSRASGTFNRDVWLRWTEAYKYLERLIKINNDEVNITSYRVNYKTEPGLNMAISYYDNHAFLIVIAQDWNGHNEVYLSDANNVLIESNEETQDLINEILTDIDVDEAKIIMQTAQRKLAGIRFSWLRRSPQKRIFPSFFFTKT